jgi:hypothetical protein
MRTKNAGITVLELVVSFGLIGLATMMIVALFVPSMSLFRRQSGKSDSYRSCIMLVEKFRTGLMNSQIETVTIGNDKKAISWQLVDEAVPFSAATGDALMTKNFAILYYVEDEKRVYYKIYEHPDPLPSDRPSILSQTQLDTARAASSSKTYVIGRDMVEFEITDRDGDVAILEPPLSLSITCEVDTKGKETNDTESFSLQSSVTPRSMRW